MASELPVETSLLRTAAGLALAPAASTVIETLLPLLPKVDWHRVLWQARHEGALLLLQRALGAPEIARACPPEIRAQLQSVREVDQLRRLARARELCQLQDLFADNSISALSVDPAPAARSSGHGSELLETDSFLRSFVPREELARATALLADAGYPVEIDPQKLIRPGRPPVRLNESFGRHASAHRFWEYASTFELGGRLLWRLSLAHWLLMRAPVRWAPEHITFGRAFEVVNLARQVSSADWPGILAEAARFEADPPFAAGIVACHRALDLPPPAELAMTAGDAPSPARYFAANDPHTPMVAAPFLPTPPVVVRRMLEIAGTRPTDLVCDLGCGDGRIAIVAAKEFGARAVGIDRDPARIAEATTRALAAGVHDRVALTCGDLFAADIANATVVTCYLLPQLQPPLLQKLRREARPGTRIVSHDFIFPGWPPEKTAIIRTGPLRTSQIYLWILR